MKRIVASIGLVAVGASGVQAALLPGLTSETDKPWNLSATLRGFYDDNYNAWPDDIATPANFHRSATGFELSPSLQFSFPMEQTSLSFGYVYSLKYYQYAPYLQEDHYDQTHEFNVALTHAFSERYQLTVRDSFVIGQEPDILRAGNTFNTFQRVSGSNIRNYGTINLLAQMTPELGVEVGYANTLYSYADNVVVRDGFGRVVVPSYSGVLDSLDHVGHVDLRYQFSPQTIGLFGYQFRQTDYIGHQEIGWDPVRGQAVWSDQRNARSHYLYVGLEHNFRKDLTGSVRAGGRYTDYYNNPAGQDITSPYAMVSLNYTYLPESYLQFGASYDYSATSLFDVDPNTGNYTLNTASATVFAAVRHRITPKLYATVDAQFQDATAYGGRYNNQVTKYYLVGLNLQYRFTRNFSAEVGYNYDIAETDSYNRLNYSYDRNRVYVGVTASY